MGVEHGVGQFYSALRDAVSSRRSPQEKLASVLTDISHLQRDSFPPDAAWEHFQALMKEATKRQAQFFGDSEINATTSRMTDEQAQRLLRSTLDLFNELFQG